MRKVKTISHKEFAVEMDLLATGIKDSVEDLDNFMRILLSARIFCPVKTGALRDSIRLEKRGEHLVALVAGGAAFINPETGREVDYAVYVHEGTSRMLARPFLTQAIQREKLVVGRRILTETLERI